MKKKILSVVAISCLFMGTISASGINGEFKGNPIVRVSSNGTTLAAEDTPAIIYEGRTMVPIYMLRNIGFDVTWDSSTYSVDVKTKKPEESNDYTLISFHVFSDVAMEVLKKDGISVDSYSVNVTPHAINALVNYDVTGLSADKVQRDIFMISTLLTNLEYKTNKTIIDTYVKGKPTGKIEIYSKDAEDLNKKVITLSEYQSKWIVTNY